jgi:cell division protein FtsQ
MWDNPDVLNRITRLILAATLLFTLWTAGRAALEAWFPFREITVVGARHPETREAVRALAPRLSGGFFSMDLNGVHAAFEQLPWVRNADVRRLWPGRLVVRLEEHRAAAAWNDRALLDIHGEVFEGAVWRGVPRFYAPEGMEREVARRYGEFARIIAPLGMRVEQLVVSARQSWRIRLSGGISVELGRERLDERLARFARFYPRAVAAVGSISRVDMRYPNGFAGEAPPTPGAKVDARRATQA